jgi:hypothetical protein
MLAVDLLMTERVLCSDDGPERFGIAIDRPCGQGYRLRQKAPWRFEFNQVDRPGGLQRPCSLPCDSPKITSVLLIAGGGISRNLARNPEPERQEGPYVRTVFV